MTRFRWFMLLLCILLLMGIAHEQAVANALDADCGAVCKRGCASEGGCRLFRQIGCSCRFVCNSGAQGTTVCGG